MKKKRDRNDGLRKVCECSRRTWAKCDHPWHANLRFCGTDYRVSLTRVFPDRDVSTKLKAEAARDELFGLIRNGKFRKRSRGGASGAACGAVTLRALVDRYEKGHVIPNRPDSEKRWRAQVDAILRRSLMLPTGDPLVFGDWPASDITLDAIEQFRDLRRPQGKVAMNRDCQALRAILNWSVARGLIDCTPFTRGGVATVKRAPENRRSRRLQPGEGERLLAACPQPADPTREPHPIRSLIEAALETGCRRGELLSLQWANVRLDGARPAIVLVAQKTKTRTQREVPISARLRAVLEHRRHGADGEPHPLTAHVFGRSDGEPITEFKRAWQSVRLRAHGHTPVYQKRTAKLTPECQEQLRKVGLHFHDLRREAGSRWLDAGIPLHTIQRWLGHTNISQTSTYLAVTDTGSHEAMARFDALRLMASGERSKEQADASSSEGSLQIANPCANGHDETRLNAMAVEKTSREMAESVN